MNINHYKTDFENAITIANYTKNIFDRKKQSFEEFLTTGLPTSKWEDWRHTKLSKLNNVKPRLFSNCKPNSKGYLNNITDFNNSIDLVFHNGFFQKNLSSKLPKGVTISDDINSLLDIDPSFKKNPFSLLNSAFLKSGLKINVEKNQILNKPLRIIYNSHGKNSEILYPRVILNIGESASCSFIEYHQNKINNSFQNSVTQISIKNNASLDHIKIQKSLNNIIDISSLTVRQEKESNYNYFQYCDGTGLERNNLNILLDGNSSNCDLSGVSLTKNVQQVDNNIIVEHKGKYTTSFQNFKSILDDKSSGIFNGKVIINENAIKTDASQSNKNLILSKDARMNSNPQMEIYNDDVRCAHGSSTGELDHEALFYMRSRGLNFNEARSLLIRGFISDLISKVKHKDLRNKLFQNFDLWISESND